MYYPQTSDISCTLDNKIVDHSKVVGALPVCAAPTASSFSTLHLASMDWTKTTTRWDEKHYSFGDLEFDSMCNRIISETNSVHMESAAVSINSASGFTYCAELLLARWAPHFDYDSPEGNCWVVAGNNDPWRCRLASPSLGSWINSTGVLPHFAEDDPSPETLEGDRLVRQWIT